MSVHSIQIKRSNKEIWRRWRKRRFRRNQQLHDRSAFKPVDWKQLSREQKRQALDSLIFVKQKRCGRLKGRTCDDSRNQRDKFIKEEIASPKVALESVYLTSMIDAKENRDVETLDLPNAFM